MFWGPFGPLTLGGRVGFFSQIRDMTEGSVCANGKENRSRLPIGSKILKGPSWAPVGPIEILMLGILFGKLSSFM